MQCLDSMPSSVASFWPETCRGFKYNIYMQQGWNQENLKNLILVLFEAFIWGQTLNYWLQIWEQDSMEIILCVRNRSWEPNIKGNSPLIVPSQLIKMEARWNYFGKNLGGTENELKTCPSQAEEFEHDNATLMSVFEITPSPFPVCQRSDQMQTRKQCPSKRTHARHQHCSKVHTYMWGNLPQ